MRVHEGALNDAINYAQKGWAMQMRGITLTTIRVRFWVPRGREVKKQIFKKSVPSIKE